MEYKIFESKKDEIKNIEDIIKNNNGDYNKYLCDIEIAKNMNIRYEIIKYLIEKKNVEKTEENIKIYIDSWKNIEQQIKDKKFKKMKKDFKTKMCEYFSDENNKELLIKIFNKDIYDYFIKENIPINDLKEILNYYQNFLFESKKDEIKRIEDIIKNNNVDYNKYLNDI